MTKDLTNTTIIRRNARVTFSDGTTIDLEDVNATKQQMIKHYNQFCKIFMRNHGAIHVTDVEFT
jgi:hypothetical protein